MPRILAIAACFAALIQASTGNADDKGKGHKKHGSYVGVQVFAGDDRRILTDFFTGQRGGLPPGLAKRSGSLPPGLEKQLRRKGHLPPGLEKKLYPFPPEVESRLSPLAPGFRRGYISGRAVIYDRSTSVIVDIFIP